jgi:hypothetical protein
VSRQDLTPSPEFLAASRAAQEAERAEREAARATVPVDEARVAELAAEIAGGSSAPDADAAAAEVAAIMGAGVPEEAVARVVEVAGRYSPAGRRAIVAAARELRARAPAPEQARAEVVPDLDVDDLLGDCPALLARVREVAGTALCLPDMPALAGLAVTSCALAARVQGGMRNRNGSAWNAWAHLFICAEVRSGFAKTLVRDMIDVEAETEHGKQSAVGEILRNAARVLRPQVSDDAAERDQFKRERTKLVAMAASNRDRLREIDERLARPQLHLPDQKPLHRVTPANFVRVAQRSGFVAALPDEGRATLEGFFAGREGREDVDPLLCAFSGSPYSNSTIAGEVRGDNPQFERLHAAMFLPIQPGVLSPRTRDEARLLARVDERGLLARLLVARPRELTVAEADALRSRPAPTDTGAAWRRLVVAIGTEPIGDHPLAPSTPHRIPFCPEAARAMLDFQARTTDSVRPGGSLHGKPGAALVARIADHAVRLATVLAVLREGRARADEVLERDVLRAIRVCDAYFLPHARMVAQRAILDPSADDAEAVLAAVRRIGAAVTRQREVQRELGRGWDAARIKRALGELEQRGAVQVESAPRGAALIRLTASP